MTSISTSSAVFVSTSLQPTRPWHSLSSQTDRVIPDDLIAVGELGLAGECRAVSHLDLRVKEAARLGFRRAIVPYRNIEKRPIHCEGIELIPIKTIYDTLKFLNAEDKKSE